MAKESSKQKNLKRRRIYLRFREKRERLKAVAINKKLAPEERFEAQLKLASLPRDSSKVRIRNRCSQTGRPRGYYRKFGISRIALRELSNWGLIPGVTKSSW